MTRQKKIFIGLAGLTGFLLVSLLALNYLATTLINSGLIKKKLRTIISQKAGGEIEYQSADLSIFPFAHVVVHQANFSIPGRARGTLDELKVFPRILPLFKGDLQFDKVYIRHPDIKIVLAQTPEKNKKLSLDKIKAAVIGILSSLSSELSEIDIEIVNGRFNLTEKDENVFQFSGVQAEIGLFRKTFEIRMNCASNLWKSISADASFDLQSLDGSGGIMLKRFQPQALIGRFSPNAAFRITKPIKEMDLRFKTNGLGDLNVSIKGTLPSVSLSKGDKNVDINGKDMESVVHINKDKIKVSLIKLTLDDFPFDLSGKLLIEQDVPRVSVELTGRDVDVHPVREKALALAGDNRIIKKIFSIMRGGRVPFVTFKGQAKTFKELRKKENHTIKGSYREGDVFVPKLGLEVEDVYGDVVVKNGILKGVNAGARLGGIQGREGEVRMGLKGKSAPFHVEIYVTTNADQIIPTLNRFIKNKSLKKEISRVSNLKGFAEGKLVLGERMNSIKMEVDADKFNMSADYEQVPYPLRFEGGFVHYDRSKIIIKDLNGIIGQSSFSGLTARIGLKKPHNLEIQSGKAFVYLNEIYPWISSFEKINTGLKDLRTLSGGLNVTAINLKGPLSGPGPWRFKTTGEVEDIIVDTALFPGPVKIKEADFDVDDKMFLLADAHVNALDASLKIAGSAGHNMAKLTKTDLAFNGEMEQESLAWILEYINLPSKLRVRPPISISQAHLSWQKNTGTSFVGNFALEDGPEISLDVYKDHGDLKINDLIIKDEESNASFAFGLKEKEYRFKFAGNLSQITLDKIFLNNGLSLEWIKGDFQAHIFPDQPAHSTVKGMLEGKGLLFPWKQKEQLAINNFLLTANNNNVKLHPLVLTWGGHQFALNGNINTSDEGLFDEGLLEDGLLEDGIFFDVDVSADGLDWDMIKEIVDIKKNEHQINENEDVRLYDFPLKGVVRLDSDNFTYGQFTWKPLQANISLANDRVDVEIANADLCGISFPGIVKVTPQDISLDFQLLGRNQELETSMECLGDKKGLITGKLDVEAQVKSLGTSEDIAGKFRGYYKIKAKDGRIYRYGLLSKLFAFLNFTEIFRGRFPDLVKEGFAYKSIIINGDVQNGILMTKEAIIDGSSMQITGSGNIDFIGKEVDLEILVSPLKTLDFIIKKTPVVNKILGGTLVAFPVSIKGDLEDPKFSILSPSSIGGKLLGFTKRVLKAPVYIIEPVIPGKGKKEKP